MFRRKKQKTVADLVTESKICPSCQSRLYQIEHYPNRGVLLPAMDITLCILATKSNLEARERAVRSARSQLLRATIIRVHVNVHEVGISILRKKCLEDVDTPYVAFMDECDILNENHLFSLANELVRTGADCVYSCSCRGSGCDCKTRYLGVTTSAREGFRSTITTEKPTWSRVE